MEVALLHNSSLSAYSVRGRPDENSYSSHKRSSRRWLGRGPKMVQQVDRDDGAGTALVDVYNIDCRVALRHLRGTRDVSPQRREDPSHIG